jgi:hypothetical protein
MLTALRTISHTGEGEEIRPLKIYPEGRVDPNLRSGLGRVLAESAMTLRMKLAIGTTIRTRYETSFLVHCCQELIKTPDEFAFSDIEIGDYNCTYNGRRSLELCDDLSVTTVLDLLDEYEEQARKAPNQTITIGREFFERLGYARMIQREIESEHDDKFQVRINGSVNEPREGLPKNVFTFAIVHTHPIIDSKGKVEPSSSDLKGFYFLRDLYLSSHVNTPPPIFIILQPADSSGNRFNGLVFTSRVFDNPRQISHEDMPSDDALIDSYKNNGMLKTLSELGFTACKFKFTNNRYYPGINKIAERLV